MRTRIITGVIAIVLWFFLLYAGYYKPFWAVMAVIGTICSYEFFAMALKDKEQDLLPLLVPLAALPLYAIYQPNMTHLAAGVFFAMLAGFLVTLYSYRNLANPFSFLGRFLFAVLYCGFLFGHIILIMSLPQGGHWLIVLSAITSASDSGAYFVGKFLGNKKLCPHISPGKTVAGFVGGVISGILGGMLLGAIFFPRSAWYASLSTAPCSHPLGWPATLPNRLSKGPPAPRIPASYCLAMAAFLTAAIPCFFVPPPFITSSPSTCFKLL